MSHTQSRMRKILARLVVTQGVVTLAIAVGFYLALSTPQAVWSVLYGGVMAVVVSLLLAWRVNRSARPGAGVAGLYLSMLERMAFIAVAFAVGLAVLELVPLALLAGFVGAEIAYVFTAGSLGGPTRVNRG